MALVQVGWCYYLLISVTVIFWNIPLLRNIRLLWPTLWLFLFSSSGLLSSIQIFSLFKTCVFMYKSFIFNDVHWNFGHSFPRYSLAGFISHVGKNTGCGHYVAHIRKDGRWAIFDDRKVRICIMYLCSHVCNIRTSSTAMATSVQLVLCPRTYFCTTHDPPTMAHCAGSGSLRSHPDTHAHQHLFSKSYLNAKLKKVVRNDDHHHLSILSN